MIRIVIRVTIVGAAAVWGLAACAPTALPASAGTLSARDCKKALADSLPRSIQQALPKMGKKALVYAGLTHGRIAVWFWVDTTGRPEASTIRIEGEAPSELATEVRRVVPSWQYTPATVNGCIARSTVREQIDFD